MIQEVVEQIERTVKDVMNSSLHTSMPARIVAIDMDTGLVDLQPVGSYYIEGIEIPYPVVPGVPMVINSTPSGVAATGPVKVGDPCIMVTTEQSLSAFLTGTHEQQMDERFELMNSVCFPGLQMDLPEVLKEAIEKDAYIIRTPDGDIVINKDGIVSQTTGDFIAEANAVELTGAESVVIASPDTEVEGPLLVTGDFAAANVITDTLFAEHGPWEEDWDPGGGGGGGITSWFVPITNAEIDAIVI